MPPTREALQYSYSPIVKKATPAVVNVYVRSRVRTQVSPFANDPFFQRFFGGRGGFGLPQERIQSSLGSGVIISADGVIVTNTHVVKGGTDTQIRVALSDKREFDARIVAQDERTDLAVLKIEKGGKDFPFLQFADSDKLEVGDVVLAIGNPFGVGQTVTSGIISALGAHRDGAGGDAGVPADRRGDQSGQLRRRAGRHERQARRHQHDDLLAVGRLGRHRLRHPLEPRAPLRRQRPRRPQDRAAVARRPARDRDARDGAQLKLDRVSGAIVVRLTDNGPAAKAGLQLGDVIVGVDGFEVGDSHSVLYRLTTRGIGNNSRLEIIRDGKHMTIDVPLLPAPKPGKDDVRNLSGNHPFDGARVSNILPSVADELNLDETDGVVIVAVRSGGVAARLTSSRATSSCRSTTTRSPTSSRSMS